MPSARFGRSNSAELKGLQKVFVMASSNRGDVLGLDRVSRGLRMHGRVFGSGIRGSGPCQGIECPVLQLWFEVCSREVEM